MRTPKEPTYCFAWPAGVQIYHAPSSPLSEVVTQAADQVTCPHCLSALDDPWVPRVLPDAD